MSDYDRWRQNQSYSPKHTADDGGAALFWVLVVVVALGVFVFASFVSGSVRGEWSTPTATQEAQQPAEVAVDGAEEIEPMDDGATFGTRATFTTSED